MYKFNGFTDKANVALNLAIKSAEEMGHTYIGSEHILLGLLKEGSGVASTVLNNLGVTADKVQSVMVKEIGVGIRSILSTDDFTPRTKRILQISVMQAARMGHNYIGTEHLLLSLIEEDDSYAVRFLNELGAKQDDIIDKIQDLLGTDSIADEDMSDMYGDSIIKGNMKKQSM